MTTIIHGIKNCDTMKKAMTWLSDNGVEFEFQDYKKQPPSADQARKWLEELPLEQLINKRGTTYRKLSDDVKDSLTKESAVELIIEQPSLLKRPLLLHNERYSLGFKPELYAELFRA